MSTNKQYAVFDAFARLWLLRFEHHDTGEVGEFAIDERASDQFYTWASRNVGQAEAVNLSLGFEVGLSFAAILANDPVTCEADLRAVLAKVARSYKKPASA